MRRHDQLFFDKEPAQGATPEPATPTTDDDLPGDGWVEESMSNQPNDPAAQPNLAAPVGDVESHSTTPPAETRADDDGMDSASGVRQRDSQGRFVKGAQAGEDASSEENDDDGEDEALEAPVAAQEASEAPRGKGERKLQSRRDKLKSEVDDYTRRRTEAGAEWARFEAWKQSQALAPVPGGSTVPGTPPAGGLPFPAPGAAVPPGMVPPTSTPGARGATQWPPASGGHPPAGDAPSAGSAPPPAPGATGSPAGQPQGDLEVPDIPEPPLYTNYETDEAYTEAVNEWRTRQQDVMRQFGSTLMRQMGQQFEARLQHEGAARQHEVMLRDLESKVAAMKEAHPDYDTKAQAAHASGHFAVINRHPFLREMIQRSPQGGEVLHALVDNTAIVDAVKTLPLPSPQLRMGLLASSAVPQLMAHFATEEGRSEFLQLAHPQMPLEHVSRNLAFIEQRLATASPSVVPSRPAPITNAPAPARPPQSSVPPGRSTRAPAHDDESVPFDQWLEAENRREMEANRARLGLTGSTG